MNEILNTIKETWQGEAKQSGLQTQARESAVVIPLIPRNEGCATCMEECKGAGYDVLFQIRSKDIKIQPGEVCLPGGRIEAGETAMEGAIREACEELLITPDQLEIVAAMDGIIGPNGATIWPFIGILNGYQGTFSKDEVDHIYMTDLNYFLTTEPSKYAVTQVTIPGEDFPFDKVPGGRDYGWRNRTYDVLFYHELETEENPVLWGFTAGLMYTMATKIKETIKAQVMAALADKED